MSKNSSIVAIFSEFLTRYQRHFGMLFLLLVVEGAGCFFSHGAGAVGRLYA